MKTERFEATSVDAAVAKGLQQLRLAREDVEVQVIQEAKKGFLGLGAKDAIVAIHYSEPEVVEMDAATDEVFSFSGLTKENTSQVATSKPINVENDQPVVEDEAIRSETPTAEVENKAEVEEEVTEGMDADEISEPVASETLAVEEETNVETTELTPETSLNEAPEETIQEDESLELVDDDFKDVEFVAEYLIDVLASYLVDANIEVEDRGRTVVYNIQTEKKGLVIGKHGKIINSLETLAQVMTHQHVRPHVKVIVNVGNYRERRQETLARLARKTADQVSRSKQPVFLDPLPAAERKIIHAQLARYSYIATHSEGKEPHRYLVVSYKD